MRFRLAAAAAVLLAATCTLTANASPSGQVTGTYGCGEATFTNPLDVPVTVTYGPAQSDAGIKDVEVPAGKSVTVSSTEERFGWTARDSHGQDVGHLWLPGADLSCDKPDATNGLADTGV